MSQTLAALLEARNWQLATHQQAIEQISHQRAAITPPPTVRKANQAPMDPTAGKSPTQPAAISNYKEDREDAFVRRELEVLRKDVKEKFGTGKPCALEIGNYNRWGSNVLVTPFLLMPGIYYSKSSITRQLMHPYWKRLNGINEAKPFIPGCPIRWGLWSVISLVKWQIDKLPTFGGRSTPNFASQKLENDINLFATWPLWSYKMETTLPAEQSIKNL